MERQTQQSGYLLILGEHHLSETHGGPFLLGMLSLLQSE